MPRPRLILADDHTILVEAFARLLQPSYDVVGCAANGRLLLVMASQLKPDLVVVDVGMPLMNGLDAGFRLKEEMPQVKLVFLTMNDDPDLALEAMRSGGSAYLLKSSAMEELLFAIQSALKGQQYVTPSMARAMENSFIKNPDATGQQKDITPRQREVVQLLAEGKSMKQVADLLSITERTVAFHKYRVMDAMNLRSSAELIQFAIKRRILVN